MFSSLVRNLLFSLFVIAVAGVSHPTISNLRITAHHKSGTVFAMNVWSMLCCASIPTDENHFWRMKDSCHRNCTVGFDFNGLGGFARCPGGKVCSYSVVHTIRHPLDMLISGYLFHKACKEPWTNSTTTDPLRFPQPFPVKGSYCTWLQSVNATTGLKMELKRTLEANDGIGRMIRDMRSLQAQPNVLTLCLNDKSSVPALAAFIEPWNKFNRTLTIRDDVQHRSSVKEKKSLNHEALGLLLERLPASAAVTFPCATENFDQDGWPYKKFLASL